MGLNSKTFKPCGFCFVEFQTRKHAEIAVECLNLASLDQNQVRLDWDYGFAQRRQFGRGRGGGQVRTEVARAKQREEAGLGAE